MLEVRPKTIVITFIDDDRYAAVALNEEGEYELQTVGGRSGALVLYHEIFD